jgi:hypothetical protein
MMFPLKFPRGVVAYWTPDGTKIERHPSGFGWFKERNVGAAMRFGFTDPLELTDIWMRGMPDYTAGRDRCSPTGEYKCLKPL